MAQSDVDLEDRLSALSERKRELFAKMLEDRGLEEGRAGAAPDRAAEAGEDPGGAGTAPAAPMDFSLFFFSADVSAEPEDRYRLVTESARFADRNGFHAVWTPERHFHAFGGLYPNPPVLSAALAMVTERVELRAGSVVAPLHDVVRIAENWSVVDNLSHGRAGVSLASGWHMNDFVFAPESYERRREITFDAVSKLRALWRGESVVRRGVDGEEVEVELFPPPVRDRLPLWITSATSRTTFERAGELGTNVLTGLTGHRVDELEGKISAYRDALARSGRDPDSGDVAVMLHTYLGDDVETVRARVREPMLDYLRTNLGLHKEQGRRRGMAGGDEVITHEDEATLLDFAFQRYFEGSALFGTPESCRRMVSRLRAAGVDEVACLLDFGLTHRQVMDGLEKLAVLVREVGSRPGGPGDGPPDADDDSRPRPGGAA